MSTVRPTKEPYTRPSALQSTRRRIRIDRALRRAQGGNSEAFGTFYDLTHAAVYDYLFFRTDDEKIAHGLLAATYLSALKRIKEIRPVGVTAEVWIMQIARETATARLHDSFGLAIVAYGTEREHKIQAMKQLDSAHQECLVLWAFLGFGVGDISAILGVPLNNVTTMLESALQMVDNLLRL